VEKSKLETESAMQAAAASNRRLGFVEPTNQPLIHSETYPLAMGWFGLEFTLLGNVTRILALGQSAAWCRRHGGCLSLLFLQLLFGAVGALFSITALLHTFESWILAHSQNQSTTFITAPPFSATKVSPFPFLHPIQPLQCRIHVGRNKVYVTHMQQFRIVVDRFVHRVVNWLVNGLRKNPPDPNAVIVKLLYPVFPI
jgi:hypothetical protein